MCCILKEFISTLKKKKKKKKISSINLIKAEIGSLLGACYSVVEYITVIAMLPVHIMQIVRLEVT